MTQCVTKTYVRAACGIHLKIFLFMPHIAQILRDFVQEKSTLKHFFSAVKFLFNIFFTRMTFMTSSTNAIIICDIPTQHQRHISPICIIFHPLISRRCGAVALLLQSYDFIMIS